MTLRPYWHLQPQKNELEAQCNTMLLQGNILSRTSTFSTPVQLVKRHIGSWRFCINYRTLNKCTGKHKFTIPIIDEVLDELHGARLFTQLDLHSRYHQVRVSPAYVEKMVF